MMSPNASEKMVFFCRVGGVVPVVDKGVRFVWGGLWHSCLCVYFFCWFCQLYSFFFFGGDNGLATVGQL